MAKKRLTLTEQVEQDNLSQKSPFNKEGISSFIKDSMANQGVEYNDEIGSKIIESYGYDYDKMVDDIGRTNKIPEESIEKHREAVYNKYGFSQPHELELAEMRFTKTPVATDPEGGFEKYKALEDELNMTNAFIQNIQPKDTPEEVTELTEEEKLLESQLESTAVDATKPLLDTELQSTSPRLLELQRKAKAIDQALKEQADYNMAKLGYTSEEHQLIGEQLKNNVSLLDEAIKTRYEKASKLYTPYQTHVTYKTEDDERVKDLRNLKEIYQDLDKLMGAPQADDKKMKALMYGLSNNFFTKDFATLGLNEMSRLFNVKSAFDTREKLQSEGKTLEEIKEIMPANELALLDAYQMMLEIQAGADPNNLYYWGEGLKDMIPFIAQFAATGGVGAGAKKAVTQFVTSKTKSSIAGKVAGSLTKSMLQAGAMVPANLQGYAERVAPTINEQGELVEGMTPLKAAAITYANTVAEVVGEDVGSFANKSANKVARESYRKMIGSNPNSAQKFLGKMALGLTANTKVPTIQGVAFEGLGEEVTGLLQSVINQDDSFFTSEAQKQIWGMSLIASGTFMSASVPGRLRAKRKYSNSKKLLDDIPNGEYAQSVEQLSNSYDNIEDLTDALGQINKQFGPDITLEDKLKARNYIANTIVYNQMNTARAIRVEEQIAKSVGQDGNVTLAQFEGQPYSVNNPQDLGQEGKVIFIKDQEGNVKPVISSKISQWDTKTQQEIVDNTINTQDKQDVAIEEHQRAEEETMAMAEEKGLIQGKTVITPNGKQTLVSVNPNGTSTVVNNKGEEAVVNTSEIEAYKTQEQKDQEKQAQKLAEEVISEEPLFEGSDIIVVDYADGTSVIRTPEGDQTFETIEERDAAIEALASAELEAADETIDDLPPEQAFAQMLQEDPEIATEVLTQDIAGIRTQSETLRNQATEVQSRQERVNLLKQAKELEAEAIRLEQILNDPTLLEEQVTEEEEIYPEEALYEQEQEESMQIERTPDVIYAEYEQEKENAPINQLLPWQEELLSRKVSRDSFNRFGDKNYITQGLARSWFVPKEKSNVSNNIDVVAQELSEMGMEVTPDDIVQFITENPTAEVRKTTDRMNELQREYKELTGEPIHKYETKSTVTDEELSEVPFRAAPDLGVKVTDKAQEDLVSKTRVAPMLSKLQETFGIPVQIINSNEMPEHVKRAAEGKQITASGFYDPTTGVAYILSDIAKNKGIAEIKRTYMHEAVLHKGLDVLFNAGPVNLLGKTFESKNDLLDEVYSRLDEATIADRAKYYTKGVSLDQLTEKQKRELAEEAMATLNETESPRLQVLMDKIYNFIKKLFGFTSKQFSKAEFRQLLRDHRDLIIKQKQDAETVRSDEGRISEAGIVQEKRDEKGREDIQQPEKTGAEASEAERVKFRTEEGQSFDEWKGNNKLVEGYDISEVKTGEPIVAKAYHGTTHEVYEFKGGEVGNIEGHLGKTNYFTSDYDDAQLNYGAEGADLTGRIEHRKERIEQELEDEGYSIEDLDAIKEAYDLTDEDLDRNIEDLSDIAFAISEKELKGQEEKVLELYVKLNNPLVLGSGPVYIEVIDEAELTDYMDDAAQEIADENGIEVEEAKEDYSFDIQQRAIENSGAEDKVVEAMRLALEGQDIYDKTIYDFLPEYYGEEVDLNQIDKDLRASEELMYLDNDEGNLINHQIISDFYEELGYDGVILTDVNDRFPNMDMGDGTSHIHVPDQYNNQIKLADGSNTTFGETSDIRFRVEDVSDQISKLEAQRKGLVSEKNRIIKQANERQGLFGDTKADPNDLFGGQGFDPKEALRKEKEINQQIEKIDGEITLLKKQLDTGKTEADGQMTMFRVAESQQELDDFVKDSKVKETVYHGTASQFDEFLLSKAKDKEGMQRGLGWGPNKFYFTDTEMSAQVAADYAKIQGKGKTPNIMRVKLNITNPITANEYNSKLKEYTESTGSRDKAVKKLDTELKYEGIDGIIDDISGGIAVFSNNQILIEPKEDVKFKVEEERDKVETNPSEKQIEAGNYQKGHIQFDGFDISIENPKGGIRKGTDEKGEAWSAILPADYGYFKRTEASDGDQIDVYLGDNLESDKVYVIDQVNPNTGLFDEVKVVMGTNSISEAKNLYMEAYEEGWQGLGAITRTTKDGLKEWFKGDTKKPFAPQEDIKFQVTSTNPKVQAMLDKLAKVQELSRTATKIKGLEQEAKEVFPELRQTVLDQLQAFKAGAEAGAKDTQDMIKEVQNAITNYAKKALPLTEAGAREISPILTLIKNAQTPEDVESALNRIDELAGVTTEKQERRKYTAKVNRLLKWMTGLKKQGTKRVGKFNYEDTKAFLELKEIDKTITGLTRTMNSNKATAEEKSEAESKLNQEWDKLNEKTEKTSLDEAMMKLIELRRLGSKASPALAQTVAEELEAIYAQAKDAKSEADIDKAISRREDKEFIKEFVRDQNLEDKPLIKRAITKLNNFTANTMGNWETLMTVLGGTKARDKFSLILNQVEEEMGIQESFNTVLDKAQKDYNLKSRDAVLKHIQKLKEEKYELRKPNRAGEVGEGAPMKLTTMNLIDIYNAVKNEDIADSYYMSYGDITLAEDGSRDTDAQRRSGKQRINALLDNLSAADKAFGDSMMAVVNTYKESTNNVFIKMFNRDMDFVENYWPSTAEFESDVDVMDKYFTEGKMPSATQQRSTGRTPRPIDAFDKFNKHVKESEWYKNMAIPLDRINKIFKDQNTQDLISEARGDEFLKTIQTHFKNLGLGASTRDLTDVERIGGNILGNWVSAKIGLTPSVPFKQLTSMINYAENMPVGTWGTGFIKGLATYKATFDFMWENVPYLKDRFKGGYSEALQYAMNATSGIPKATNTQQAIKNVATIGTRGGDIAAIVYGGKPYIDYLMKSGMSKEEAVNKFMLNTLRSQQAPFSSTLSTYQNSKNPFAKALFTFANTPSQYMRKMFEASQAYRHGDITLAQASKIYAIYGVANQFLYVGAGALISALMKGSDPEEKLGVNTIVQSLTSLVAGIPMVRDLVNTTLKRTTGLHVYDDALPVIGELDQIGEAVINALQGKKPEENIEKAFILLMEMGGIPAGNAKKLWDSTVNREEVVAKTVKYEVKDRLNELTKSKNNFEARTAKDIKKTYSKAQSKATRLRNEGKTLQADRIEQMIEDSKMRLRDNKYQKLGSELRILNRQLELID